MRRTRADLMRQIDGSLTRSIVDAGGKIIGDRFVLSAVFDEDSISFWFEIFLLIENLKKSMESSDEFFGYSLVICGKEPKFPELLSRFLANYSGVFVDEIAAKKLLPYASFIKPHEWLYNREKRKYGCNYFYKIDELRIFKQNDTDDISANQEAFNILEQDNANILFLTSSGYSIRDCLRRYNKKINGNFPALTVDFKTLGIGALVDIWSLNIRSLGGGKSKEEIDKLWEFLFKERIRDEVSEYVERCVKRFLLLVFNYYINAADKKNHKPVFLIENIHIAEKNTVNFLLNGLSEYLHTQGLRIIGTASDKISQKKIHRLKSVFANFYSLENSKTGILIPKLSYELWEIIYVVSLLNRYFSPELIQRLFEEEDKNPAMISKALSILHSLNVTDSAKEPRLMKNIFEEYAVKLFGHQPKRITNDIYGDISHSDINENRIKSMVINRLINWAELQKINTCFRLLSIICDLGGVKQIDDMLLLKAITFDIANNTVTAVEAAINSRVLDTLFDKKAVVIRHLYQTSKVLNSGNKEDIEKIFNNVQTDEKILAFKTYPVFNAQMIVNLSCYYLSRQDDKKAVEKAKEVMLLSQNENAYCLSQSYRIYSLVCLSKQRISETIEYFGFALSYAERIGNNHELAISAYYAAATQFLYGDIYTALKLTRKSIEQSLGAGHPDWADRSRFLEGRLEFELGYYQKAFEIFKGLKNDPYGIMTCEKENLLIAWIYRSQIYFMETEVKKPGQANFDADLFEIEAAYLSGDYKKAYALSLAIVNPFTEENYLYTEKADWLSGFSQCEHLYFTKGEIQSGMIELYNALSLSHLALQDSEYKMNDAVQAVQKMLRDKKLCEIDPCDPFYFYAKYRILQRANASSVDLSTAVSMAFKRLQRRAGRIENIETRRQYLNVPKWNSELMAVAKEFRLI